MKISGLQRITIATDSTDVMKQFDFEYLALPASVAAIPPRSGRDPAPFSLSWLRRSPMK
jgi:hypothetical protein